jgi:MtrB/PioB family decaheme-associated outer membrane protein
LIMKTIKLRLAFNKISLAVQGALVALLSLPLLAVAEDATNADAEALKHPTNYVEIGVTGVSDKSAKFGEYNGLDDTGGYGIGNFNVRGGNAYDGKDGVNRWEVKGADLGTTSRELSGTVTNQGQWSLGVSYDELRRHITDTYQTPFQGSMGGNNFVLPDIFGVIDANHADPAGTGTQGMTATQKALFHTENVYTGRKNTSFSAGYIFDPQWSAQFDYNRLNQSGAKLIGISFSPDAAGNGAGENITTLMNPTNYRTDTYNLALNWNGENGHLTASYFASLFKDENSSVSWANPFVNTSPGPSTTGDPVGGPYPVNTFATAPSNDFHQLNLIGGYDLTESTKIAGGLSYGRNTQDNSFINDPLLQTALPRTSLGGLVITTHADMKLTNQTTPDLVLSAGVKYNERDNRTPSSIYGPFTSVAGDPFGTVVNTPLSNRKTQLEFAGNYRIDKRQSVHLAYEYEAIKRWCNDSLANTFQSADVVALYPAYYTNSACVQSPQSDENKLSAGYKFKVSNSLSFNTGYTYARRIADINNSYYNPMQTSAEGLQNFGFVPYFDASRTEQLLKAGITWRANDKLNLGLNGRYINDDYDSTLGVQQGHTWGLNLDAAYKYSQDGTISAYLSVQRRERNLLAGSDHLAPLTASTNLWSNKLTDDTDTVGIAAKQVGLLGGKLELVGNLSYSLGTTGYSTQLQYADPLCSTYAITCGDLPDIQNRILRLKLTSNYQVNKASKVAFGYLYQHLNTNNYYYNAYQTGSTDVTVMPTNQQSPNYSVNVITAAYIYSF